jgi:mRNA-degrading endonuclease RelE of RelBE toxin-antitoxin system
MSVRFLPSAQNDYDALPVRLKRAVDKQLGFLLRDILYPSLRAKKYDETNDIWQARVNNDYRFYFRIAGDEYRILRVIPHPK